MLVKERCSNGRGSLVGHYSSLSQYADPRGHLSSTRLVDLTSRSERQILPSIHPDPRCNFYP
jgi:hypothetical protein